MKDIKNVLLVGVGGQGIILASKILTTGLIDAGYDVKMSEVHGMAQRGGSVTTQVRYGQKVHSPIIGKGQADVIVAFEKIEALRWIDYLKPDGKIVINDYEIPSATVIAGKERYPEGVIEKIKSLCEDVTVIKAADEATKLGNIKAQNIVMLGGLIKALGIENVDWQKAVRENVKEKFVDLNIKAIETGMQI
ncbi:indolepyruvate ferredoxin oxidoreductase beta subunit [Alkalithermobacter thermoalcaliphilus JW-YL-7 = DSM 7308]|uniref:Indolepyruvate ferredoxin oxidoreductase n=1 Tax=Alkalithermobacter thermoalcaliphilus JW-YL-7 = DSM 7308 TaxID=1121328 RepID=A0A150FP56_CLOPD|nr:Indolepyruvate ferredoxin oxidoreductase [[Clostridium] paradoxum JW-YL-7 = DSM 7308]SHK54821.1 indolepyruvate ferredoxin oxidoreductase beta subunit [[Clostridium] paradoxum JW-YL-7 = DSM 7308]